MGRDPPRPRHTEVRRPEPEEGRREDTGRDDTVTIHEGGRGPQGDQILGRDSRDRIKG